MFLDFDSKASYLDAFSEAFISRERRARHIELAQTEKGMKKLLSTLPNWHKDILPATILCHPQDEQDALERICSLCALSVDTPVLAFCEKQGLEGCMLPLEEALKSIAFTFGGVVLVPPGQIAYYEGEFSNPRLLLRRVKVGMNPDCGDQ